MTTHIVTPEGKPHDEQRILINLHGGGFSVCAEACALLESIPVAALGAYKVITVDYRMAPESVHPAAVQDLEIVYRELLNENQILRKAVTMLHQGLEGLAHLTQGLSQIRSSVEAVGQLMLAEDTKVPPT